MADARTRVVFLDPSLGAVRGHHARVAENYRALLTERGIHPIFIGARTPRADAIPSGADFTGLFPYRADEALRVAHYGGGWRSDRALIAAAKALTAHVPVLRRAPARATEPRSPRANLARALAGLGAANVLNQLHARFRPNADDHLVILNDDPALLTALSEASALWSAPTAPRLHIVAMYPQILAAPASPIEAAYRDVLSWPNVAVYAESAAYADWLRGAFQHDVSQIVSPTRLAGAAPSPSPSPCIVAALGSARADKGFADLPAIAAATHMRAPDVAFRIQGAAPESGLSAVEQQLRALPNVTLTPPWLSDAAYDAELERAHIVLLPYDANIFAMRGSGVLFDALIAGRPVICAQGAALAASVVAGAGRTAETAEEYATAIADIERDYESYSAAAAQIAAQHIDAIRKSPLLAALTSAR